MTTTKTMKFAPEMIQALREGRKTQTRRPCTTQPYEPGDRLCVPDAPDLRLTVTSVRAERIQRISNADITAEGVTPRDLPATGDPWDDFYERYEVPFMELWDSIYEQRGHGWDRNPWVWVYGLKVEANEATK